MFLKGGILSGFVSIHKPGMNSRDTGLRWFYPLQRIMAKPG